MIFSKIMETKYGETLMGFLFKNNTFMGGAFDEFGEFYCEKLFIGTINNYIDEEPHFWGRSRTRYYKRNNCEYC